MTCGQLYENNKIVVLGCVSRFSRTSPCFPRRGERHISHMPVGVKLLSWAQTSLGALASVRTDIQILTWYILRIEYWTYWMLEDASNSSRRPGPAPALCWVPIYVAFALSAWVNTTCGRRASNNAIVSRYTKLSTTTSCGTMWSS